MSLYSSSEEEHKVPLPKLYVPMIWRPYSQRGYGEEEELSSYTDIYQKVCSFLSPVEIKLKGTHTVYFNCSLYIINQKPMIPRTHFQCINSWVAQCFG